MIRASPAALVAFAILVAPFPGRQALAAETFAGPVTAAVEDVIDGDTLVIRARLWLGLELATRVRIRGIDTPELHSTCAAEKQMAGQARQRLAALAGNAVHLTNVTDDKYGGRVDADVTGAGGVDLKAAMLATGLAHPYDGRGARADWCPVASVSR